jgi:hypothetical protein
LYPLHVQVQHVQALQLPLDYKHQKAFAKGSCSISNLSQMTVADGWSMLHMDWDSKYTKPAHTGWWIIQIVGEGGVQLGPLGMSATNWPIVPAPGDYEDGEFGGMMTSRENQSTWRKPAPVPLCPPQIPHDLTGH